MQQVQKNTNPVHPWTWFADKVLPSLMVALCLAVAGGMYGIYQKIDVFGKSLDNQQREIESLKIDVSFLRQNAVTRSEQLETMKRIEQQIEIMMLRSGINAKIKMTE
jgi:hypothetical protein